MRTTDPLLPYPPAHKPSRPPVQRQRRPWGKQRHMAQGPQRLYNVLPRPSFAAHPPASHSPHEGTTQGAFDSGSIWGLLEEYPQFQLLKEFSLLPVDAQFQTVLETPQLLVSLKPQFAFLLESGFTVDQISLLGFDPAIVLSCSQKEEMTKPPLPSSSLGTPAFYHPIPSAYTDYPYPPPPRTTRHQDEGHLAPYPPPLIETDGDPLSVSPSHQLTIEELYSSSAEDDNDKISE